MCLGAGVLPSLLPALLLTSIFIPLLFGLSPLSPKLPIAFDTKGKLLYHRQIDRQTDRWIDGCIVFWFFFFLREEKEKERGKGREDLKRAPHPGLDLNLMIGAEIN